jgi:diguanylate cyclase (GGDEF)-like protein/PAS domain S-box-containing protein
MTGEVIMPEQSKVNILLVDDKPENLLVLEAIIACDEYNLVKAFSGEEALKYLLKYDFAVILLDVQMPVMDGFDTAKIIKERRKTKNTPILFITANYLDSKHILTGYSLGAMDYILKPFDPIILKSKVKGFVEVYKLNKKLAYQADMLSQKTKLLEKTCSELSAATSDLQVSEALANVISDTTIDSMIVVDDGGSIIKVNPAVNAMFGYPQSEIIGKHITDLFSSDNAKDYINMMLQPPGGDMSASNPGYLEDVMACRRDGTDFPAELQIGWKNVQDKRVMACTVRDVTRKKQDALVIRHMAYFDSLTDLPNRRNFYDRLESMLESAKQNNESFAVMILDIDGYKHINSMLGYQPGDQLIIQIAQGIKALLSDEAYLCRYSEDQFGILVPGLSSESECESIAKGLRDLFSRAFKVGMYELDVSMSLGISFYPGEGQDVGALVKFAGSALQWARKEGKNKYRFYSSEINIESFKQFELSNDLRKSIEADQLKVHYQPQVNLKTGEILAAEALMRWEHPKWGMVSPGEFIHIAEETGFIIEMGYWLLRKVCSDYKQWMDDRLPRIKVSINLSGIQFYETNFVDNIKKIIDEYGLDPHFLIVEITENILIIKNNKAMSDIRKLRSLGIWVALDDFGTGFSSLSYLNSLDIDIIKIDRSFVKRLLVDETGTIITKSIIGMAGELKIKVAAEGIENWDQLSFLQKVNCYAGQGYIYSKPVPAEEFRKILAKKKCKPVLANDAKALPHGERRKFFRIKFSQYLEAELSIIELRGKKVNVGNTRILIKNIGPGGLCFVSKIKFPVTRDILLQFTMQLLGKEVRVFGYSVWMNDIEDGLTEYGIEFKIDENDRMELIRLLNQIQIKTRNNILFADGSFVPVSPAAYFRELSIK